MTFSLIASDLDVEEVAPSISVLPYSVEPVRKSYFVELILKIQTTHMETSDLYWDTLALSYSTIILLTCICGCWQTPTNTSTAFLVSDGPTVTEKGDQGLRKMCTHSHSGLKVALNCWATQRAPWLCLNLITSALYFQIRPHLFPNKDHGLELQYTFFWGKGCTIQLTAWGKKCIKNIFENDIIYLKLAWWFGTLHSST